MRVFLYFALCLALNNLQAQNIRALVQDEDGQPIAYCSVGLYGKGTGTVTNEKGIFNFSDAQIAGVSRIKLSHIAYESHDLSIQDIKAFEGLFVITLKAKIFDTGAITVVSDGFDRETVLGSQNAESGVIRSHSEKLNYGEIMGNRFVINQPSLLEELQFKVELKTCQSAKFRVRLIEMKKKKMTDVELLTKDLFVEVDSSGWYSADLSQFDLVVESNLLVALEFLGAEGCPQNIDGQRMPYAFHMADYEELYTKTSNTEEWIRQKGLGIAFQLKILH